MSIGTKRWICYVIGLIPIYYLLFRTLTNNLGIDPYDELIKTTGDYSIIFLLLTLWVSPLSKIKKIKKFSPQIYRLPLGLNCFTFASVHFLVFLTFDLQFNLNELVAITMEKPYILVGVSAYILLCALAITSLQVIQKKMGGYKWKMLHRSIYLIIILAILHYYWLSKILLWDWFFYLIVTVLVLGYRIKLKTK